MRHRDTGQLGSGHRGGNAGDHRHLDARLSERDGFFAAASEDERVAALEPHHTLAVAGVVDEHLVGGLLRGVGAARNLANVDAFGVEAIQQSSGREPVVEDDVGTQQRAHASDGDQLWVAGSAPN